MKFTQAGKPVANFSLAVNESFKSRDGEKKDHVEWFNCVCWGKLAEVAGLFVTNADQVFLEGGLQSRKYDGRKGNPREVIEVVAMQLRLLSGIGNRSGGREPREAVPAQPGPDKQQEQESAHDSEIPS